MTSDPSLIGIFGAIKVIVHDTNLPPESSLIKEVLQLYRFDYTCATLDSSVILNKHYKVQNANNLHAQLNALVANPHDVNKARIKFASLEVSSKLPKLSTVDTHAHMATFVIEAYQHNLIVGNIPITRIFNEMLTIADHEYGNRNSVIPSLIWYNSFHGPMFGKINKFNDQFKIPNK